MHVQTRILEAALDSFARIGYHGTTMRDISRIADCSNSTAYEHFTSKYDILVSIIDSVMGELEHRLGEVLVGFGNHEPAELVAAIVSQHVLVHTRYRQRESLVAATEWRSLKDPEQSVYLKRRDQYELELRQVVVRGCAAGQFTTGEPIVATRAILNMGSAVATWYRPDGETSPEEMSQIFSDLALATVGYSGVKRS